MSTSQSFRVNAASLAVALCFAPVVVWANPLGGVVVNGSATMVSNGNTLTITNTPGTVLNWQQFNIGKGETTRFVQPSAQSSVLNRVVSNNPSQILGTLSSNGQVFLINPYGILFGVGSVVDVNGLIASTLNISNADFLLGRSQFIGSNGTSVVNQGTITTPLGGRVYLIGNQVTNQGVITSPQGQVLLAAGNQVSLVDSNTPHISVTVSAPAGGQALNLGTVSAQGGSIDVYAPLIQQQGVLRADSASRDPQGNIVLSASQNVTVAQGSVTSADGIHGGTVTVQSAGSAQVAGQVTARGSHGVGGVVSVLGKQVTLDSSAQLDASGTLGGGSLRVGGDFQGKNTAVQNAKTTTVAAGATLRADALNQGNGGLVVVWADDRTDYAGQITARGGAQGGNGGRVEVSGKRVLAYRGMVDTLAPLGQAGSLLLDPTGTYCISNSTALLGCPGGSIAPSTVVSNVLLNGSYTVQTTAGDVVVLDPVVMTPTAAALNNKGKSLILQANGGNVLTLGSAAAGSYASTSLGGHIVTYGANLTLNASGTQGTGEVHLGTSIATNGGAFNLTATGNASMDGSGGPFMLQGQTAATLIYQAGVATDGGNVSISAQDFWLGQSQLAPTLSRPAMLDTTMLPAALNTPPVGGMLSIKGMGPGVGAGVTIGSGSSISTGTGKISLSGMNYTNLNTAHTATPNYSIRSAAQANFSFDQISNSFLDASVNAVLVQTYASATGGVPRDVYLGMASNNPVCANALCFAMGSVNHVFAPTGMAVGSLGNMVVASNLLLEGSKSQYALVALGNITLNGGITVTAPAGSVLDPYTGIPVTMPLMSVGMIAGGNVFNNVGASALTLPAGHGWSVFAQDQRVSNLNGLTATVLNFGQPPATFAAAISTAALGTLNNSSFSFPALLASLLTTSAQKVAIPSNSFALFWGTSTVAPANTGTTASVLPPTCATNPVLCPAGTAATVQQNTQTLPNASSILKPTPTALADLTYSASLGVGNGGMVWVVSEDVWRARRAARQAEDEVEVTRARLHQDGDAAAGVVGMRTLALQEARIDRYRADGRVRETEMELQAAEAEVRNASSPLALRQAETRLRVADYRRADAEVQQLRAELRHVHADGLTARSADEKQALAARVSEVTARLARAEVKRAAAEVQQAAQALKQPMASSETSEARRADLAVKQATLALKQAEVEVAQASEGAPRQAAEDQRAQASVNRAVAVAKKSALEAQRAAAGGQSAAAQRVALVKQADAEVDQAEADLQQTQRTLASARDPLAQRAAAQQVTQQALTKAERELRQAELHAQHEGDALNQAVVVTRQAAVAEKRAAVALQMAADEESRAVAAQHLAVARSKTALAEQQQAGQEASAARVAASKARAGENRDVWLKQAAALDAVGQAKAAEADVHQAEAALQQAESDMHRAQAALKGGLTPAQRTTAESSLAQKRDELAHRRDALTQRRDVWHGAREAAEQQQAAYHEARARRDERVVEAFGGMDLSAARRGSSQALMSMRQDFMRARLGAALKVLAVNPAAGSLHRCNSGNAGSDCLPREVAASQSADVMARVQLPLPVPTRAFLPEIQRKIAVVIGVNAYQDPDIPALNGALRDADAVGAMLRDRMGYDVRMVRNGTRADIVSMLREVADETGSHDSVVVYYAGHGYELEDTREGYWIPSDGATTNPENWISNGDISQLLNNIPARQMLVVSDSCFSGSLVREMKVSSKQTSVETPQQILQKRSVLVMSSGGDEPVMDEGRDGHSVFTWHLLDKVNTLGSYEHGAEIFDAIKAGVAADGLTQVPDYGASLSAGHKSGGDYLFEIRQY